MSDIIEGCVLESSYEKQEFFGERVTKIIELHFSKIDDVKFLYRWMGISVDSLDRYAFHLATKDNSAKTFEQFMETFKQRDNGLTIVDKIIEDLLHIQEECTPYNSKAREQARRHE
jgi:hypothetical protein